MRALHTCNIHNTLLQYLPILFPNQLEHLMLHYLYSLPYQVQIQNTPHLEISP